jgi:carbon-monoxide dehydrogenase small subunit
MKITLTINDKERIIDTEVGEYLLDTLRRLGYVSVRRGCDTTSCGVCTVLLDGEPVPSCSVLTVRLDGRSVTTVEGIQKDAERLSEYFGDEGADQCGYCNPSIALVVHALKQNVDDPSDDDIRDYLVANLCRCTGYVSQQKAIRRYLEDERS